MVSRQFIKFAFVGGLAAGVNWGSRALFSGFIPVEAAVAAAYLVGMTTAFALNRAFVFEPSGRSARSDYVRFSLVNLVALVQVWIVTMGLLRIVFPAIGFTWRAEDVAHGIGVLSPIVTSYLGHRHFSFAQRDSTGEKAAGP